jgi:ParB family chromosome partitioning protein
MSEDPARNRLGRGLAALIGDVGSEATVADRGRGQRRLPIAVLRASPRNPRRAYDADDLNDLASSIREKGIVQPILVRPVPGSTDGYEIIAGERRWRAAQKAGLHDVPVVIHNVSDKEALELAIIENVQRADLNAIEEGLGYQQLIEQYEYTQAALADVIGKSRPHIANTLRLLKLPVAVQDYVREGKLSAGHARALVTMDDPAEAARRIVESGLSVREAEALSQEKPKEKRVGGRPKVQKDADTLKLEKDVSDRLGLAVTIENRGESGELRVKYTSLEQLDEVCRRLQAS